jgi:hypothetical protein
MRLRESGCFVSTNGSKPAHLGTTKANQAMNHLLHSISWHHYLAVVVVAAIIYYLIVILRYYGPEITNFFRNGSLKAAAKEQSNPFMALQQDTESDDSKQPGIYQYIEGRDVKDLEAQTLIVGLRAQIAEFSGQPYQPAAVPPRLKAIIRNYRHLKNSLQRAAINELVVAECEKTGIALLTEDEVDQWWSD